MVSAGRCGFCETCFILASIATLTQSRTFEQKDGKITQFENEYGTSNQQLIFNADEYNMETYKKDISIYDYGTKDENTSEKSTASTEGWCVIWYLGAFGSLVCFFLVITCMELFFRMPQYRQSHLTSFIQNLAAQESKTYVPETPPPPYHLFAPPDYYETVQKAADDKRKTLDIFVIPVYEKPPPPLSAVQQV